jgi:hypothetical protein
VPIRGCDERAYSAVHLVHFAFVLMAFGGLYDSSDTLGQEDRLDHGCLCTCLLLAQDGGTCCCDTGTRNTKTACSPTCLSFFPPCSTIARALPHWQVERLGQGVVFRRLLSATHCVQLSHSLLTTHYSLLTLSRRQSWIIGYLTHGTALSPHHLFPIWAGIASRMSPPKKVSNVLPYLPSSP